MEAPRIRAYRRAKNLTQEKFAVPLGVKASTVAMWEKGQEPSGPALKLLELLIDGKHPFNGSESPAPWDVVLTLSDFEKLEEQGRARGFAKVRDYIAHLAKAAIQTDQPKRKQRKRP